MVERRPGGGIRDHPGAKPKERPVAALGIWVVPGWTRLVPEIDSVFLWSEMFDKVDQKGQLPDLEKQLLAKWKEERTFQKSLELRAGRPRFFFYEGPPTANGKPATHHILARAFKDLFRPTRR